MTKMRTRAGKGSELTHGELDANFVIDVDIKTTTYSALVTDNRTTLECNHATVPFTVTLGAAATMAAAETGDYEITVSNIGAAAVTVARAGSDTIDGAATSIVLTRYTSVTLKVNAATNGYNTVSDGNRPKSQEVTLVTGSLTTGSSTSTSVAHSLGTDNVYVIVAGNGATDSNYQGSWARPDGYGGRCDGVDIDAAPVGAGANAPAAGNVKLAVTNKSVTTQVITLKALVIAIT